MYSSDRHKSQLNLLLCWILVVCSQQFVLGQSLHNLEFKLLSRNEGLSSALVSDLIQDKNGFLWAGTYDGLNRYDGFQFKVFKNNEHDNFSLLHDNGQYFYLDTWGRLFIAYSEGGFSIFQPEHQKFIHYNSDKLKPRTSVDRYYSIKHIDSDSSIWFSGNGLGLNIYYPSKDSLEQYDIPELTYNGHIDTLFLNTVRYIYKDATGVFWLCTPNGLYSFDRERKAFSFKSHPLINSNKRMDDFVKLIPDGKKGFWLASYYRGMSYFNLSTERFEMFELNTGKSGYYDIINDISIKSENEFWVCSIDHGFGVFNKLNGKFEFIPNQKANNDHKFIDVLKSINVHSGQLFLADETGIYVYNPQSKIFDFKFLPIQESQHGDLFGIRGILENRKLNSIYYATDIGNGLNIQNTNTGVLTAIPIAIKPGRDYKMKVLGLFRDSMQKIWLVSRDYIFEFDEYKRRLIRIEKPFGQDEKANEKTFKYFCKSRKNQIWVLTNDGSVHPFSAEAKRLLPKINTSPAIKSVTRMQTDYYGNLWMAAGNTIAYQNQQSTRIRVLNEINLENLVPNSIRGFAGDFQGNIWVGVSRKGLLKITLDNQGKVHQKWYQEEKGLSLKRILLMQCDPFGNIWIVTISDVIRLNPENNNFQVMPHYWGMDPAVLTMSIFEGDNKKFYITAIGKYCEINFDLLDKPYPAPIAYIDKFRIYNAIRNISTTGAERVQINAEERFFSFEYSCIDLSEQRQHQFSYRLVGWDKDWVFAGTRRYASYTNLPGGDYLFEVKAQNALGEWGPIVSIPVFIQTPYYKTWWFLSLSILLITAIIFALYRYRIRDIQKTEHLKSEFNRQIAETRMEALRAQMNPHFIFNSLNSINRYIIKNDVQTSSLYLTRFAKLIRLVLDNSKHKLIPLANELEALRIYIELEAFRFENKFTYTLEVDDSLDTEFIEVPPLIIQPYVENAIWHGLLHKEDSGVLSIKVSKDIDFLIIEVEDNGVGRKRAMEFKSSNSPTRKSVGLKLTEDRIHLSGKENETTVAPEIVDLYNEDGLAIGTKVIIRIKL